MPSSRLLLAILASLFASLLFSFPAQAEEREFDYLVAPASVCGDPSLNAPLGEQQKAFYCYTNWTRAYKDYRRAPLRPSGQLAKGAGNKSGDLMKCWFGHNACGRSLMFWMHKSNYQMDYKYAVGGENIVRLLSKGSEFGALTVRVSHRSFVNSRGHRHNMVNKRYKHIGVGYDREITGNGRAHDAWTVHFAYRR
jgi:uncharacterized protein YkwD